ncbi:CBS domain containing-hemolysin-like protein [Nonomuraea thailandensis]|uniref:CBS domain containing-hemolysin-like protein n=1 Tax=Nonomuraea thailandensis TaxID=1188745 RepID=A0A9X2GSW8_9ACTN|nr:hemolysin family protein [Nonomuraea thailandensis]MCP2363167.1 CBS domain containing-hemolysin-like protein [Nonomuraea thailandensis]
MTMIILSLALLAFNALFVAAEFAFVSSRRHRLEEMAAGGNRLVRIAARSAAGGSRQLSLMLAGAQLGITLCTLGLGQVTEPALEHYLEPVFAAIGVPEAMRLPIALVIALALVTFLHMVIGEMAPKSWALTHPERAALLLTFPFRAFTTVMRPLLSALNGLTNVILHLFGVQARDELATTRTPRQLAMLVGESGRMGLLDREEHDLLTRALRLDDEGIERLMVPIDQAVKVTATATAAEIRSTAAGSAHLRLLVEGPNGVEGALHVREALLKPESKASDLIRPLPKLPCTTQVPEAVTALQEARSHLALVTNAAHDVIGMVSLTDLVGELLDTRAA